MPKRVPNPREESGQRDCDPSDTTGAEHGSGPRDCLFSREIKSYARSASGQSVLQDGFQVEIMPVILL